MSQDAPREIIPRVREFASPGEYMRDVRPLPAVGELVVVRNALFSALVGSLATQGVREKSRRLDSPHLILGDDCFVEPGFVRNVAERFTRALGGIYEVTPPESWTIVHSLVAKKNPRHMAPRVDSITGFMSPYIGKLCVYNSETNRLKKSDKGLVVCLNQGDLAVSGGMLYLAGMRGDDGRPHHSVAAEFLSIRREQPTAASRTLPRRPYQGGRTR